MRQLSPLLIIFLWLCFTFLFLLLLHSHLVPPTLPPSYYPLDHLPAIIFPCPNSFYHFHFSLTSFLCSTHPFPVLLSVEWAGWPGNTKNHSSYESFLLSAIYIIKKKKKKKETCDVTSALLPPSEGAPAKGNMHMQKHMLIHRSTNTCRCAHFKTIACKSNHVPVVHTVASLSIVSPVLLST